MSLSQSDPLSMPTRSHAATADEAMSESGTAKGLSFEERFGGRIYRDSEVDETSPAEVDDQSSESLKALKSMMVNLERSHMETDNIIKSMKRALAVLAKDEIGSDVAMESDQPSHTLSAQKPKQVLVNSFPIQLSRPQQDPMGANLLAELKRHNTAIEVLAVRWSRVPKPGQTLGTLLVTVKAPWMADHLVRRGLSWGLHSFRAVLVQ